MKHLSKPPILYNQRAATAIPFRHVSCLYGVFNFPSLVGAIPVIGFKDILDKYREQSLSKSEYGTKFEELMAGFLQTYPVYDGLFSKVYLWKDFPYRSQFGSGHDVGIDLVAETDSGFWAVQCKMYDEGRPISKADLDSFMSASSKTFVDPDGNRGMFSNRLLIATTDNLGENARAMMRNQNPPVSTLMYRSLVDAEMDWEALENNVHGKGARRPKHQLRPHQKDALGAALAHYSENDRGKLIMACGTGKTFTSLRIVEALLSKTANGGGKDGSAVPYSLPRRYRSSVRRCANGWATPISL